MGMTLSQPMAIARGILNDRDPDYRYEDADLLEYGKGAIRAMAVLKSIYLYTQGELACVADKVLQTVSFSDAHALVSVDRIKNGNVVLPADKAALDAFMPGWMSVDASAAQNWMPHLDSPIAFWIYPKAPADQILEVTFIRIPSISTAADDTGLPETLIEAVADYMVGMAEARDDDHVNSGRSAQFIAQFASRFGATAQGKAQ